VSEVVPGQYRETWRRLFASRLPGMFGKSFNAVRFARGSAAVLEQTARTDGPIVLASNHQSWWDPLVGFLLHDRWFRGRPVLSPMDRTQLAKFGFFRKLGVFGVDPDDAAGLRPFVRYVEERFAAEPRSVLMLTPQGEFVDPRRPVKVRPGIAMVMARAPGAAALAATVEYVFWNDRRPEVLVLVSRVDAPADAGSVRAWEAAFDDAMNRNAAELARLSTARDATAFDTVVGGGGARTHPVYDLWLRITGRNPSIEVAHRGGGRP
jgi:1-acyl-sn-glycerol-3-phosphate acyltransferase